MTATYLGLDIGGTVLSVGVVSGSGELLALRRWNTPREGGADACLPQLAEATRALLAELDAEHQPVAVGIGFGGPVDPQAGVVRWCHHVAGWAGTPLVDFFSRLTARPVFLENDANAGALAEARFGAGRGAQSVFYVNVGTGIGAGLVLGGRVYRGAHFNAAELGHVVLVPDGPLCPCGKRGCVEALAAGEALGRRAEQLRQAGKLDASWPPGPLTGRLVGEYASAGNATAREMVAEAARYLGWGLAVAANIVDPELIVVGGGVASLGELYFAPLRARYRELAMDYVTDVPILPASLGYDAGVIGAAAVAMVATESENSLP
jgi:glucokinase